MNRLILLLGGDLEVVNPLEKLTKGQVCELGHKAGLPDEALFRTISCGSPLFQYDHARPQHCGYCVACLLRRSGLFAALGHDETEYEFTDVAGFATLPENGKLNLAALARWSGTPYGVLDLLGDQPLPPTADLRALLDVVERGRAEIGRWLASLAG